MFSECMYMLYPPCVWVPSSLEFSFLQMPHASSLSHSRESHLAQTSFKEPVVLLQVNAKAAHDTLLRALF